MNHHHLLVKMFNWELSENVKSAFIQENQNGWLQVFVSQMYSKSLTLCRNQALKQRHNMKEEDPSIPGYIRYPATLMIKRPGQKSIRLRTNFNFILCWQSVLDSFLLICSCTTCLCVGSSGHTRDNIQH